MSRVVVTGSFDPITKGHLYVIQQALKMADEVLVWVAVNHVKTGTFAFDSRAAMIEKSVQEHLGSEAKVIVSAIESNKFVAVEAKKAGAYGIVRGIRNVIDFEYEKDQAAFNTEIEPSITTFFITPPSDLTKVSSSALKSIVGIDGWEKQARKYLPDVAVEALKARGNK